MYYTPGDLFVADKGDNQRQMQVFLTQSICERVFTQPVSLPYLASDFVSGYGFWDSFFGDGNQHFSTVVLIVSGVCKIAVFERVQIACDARFVKLPDGVICSETLLARKGETGHGVVVIQIGLKQYCLEVRGVVQTGQ